MLWTYILKLAILLPLGRAALARGSGGLANWRRYALLGLLGIGMYNSLQYLALQSSTPINVTLVASGMPVWMMLVGRLFFGAPLRPWPATRTVADRLRRANRPRRWCTRMTLLERIVRTLILLRFGSV